MKNTHLNQSDRIKIEKALVEFKSFSKIGKTLGKDRTTIAKEVKGNSYIVLSKYKTSASKGRTTAMRTGYCVNRITCEKTHECNPSTRCYVDTICDKLNKPPYVCNNCAEKSKCKLTKTFYEAEKAQNKYYSKLSESRVGVRVSSEQLEIINQILIKSVIKNKQSLYHAYVTYKEELGVSTQTLYRLVADGVLYVKPIDLRFMVKRKKNTYSKKRSKSKEIKIKKDKKYIHFLEYIKENHDLSIVELDTVLGLKEGKEKCLLTLFFRKYNILYSFLLNSKSSEEVTRAFDYLKSIFTEKEFRKYFSVILADNGSEFNDPVSIEFDKRTGNQVCKVFYCEPNSSYQRAKQERSHGFVRYKFPKGCSFNPFTQSDIEEATNQISNFYRKSLDSKTAFESASEAGGKILLKKLKITKIDPKEVNLKKVTDK